MPYDEEAFRRRLASAMKRLGRKGIAASSGISESQLSRMISRTETRREPRLSTIKAFADSAGTTVGELLGERGFNLTPEDREFLISVRDWIESKLGSGSEVIPFRSEEMEPDNGESAGPFSVPPEEFVERDFDYPRQLHANMKPFLNLEVAAGHGRESDHGQMVIPILNSVREARDENVYVVKVYGSSMEPLIRDGWKVLIDRRDIRWREWSNGKIVAIYIQDQGGVLGAFFRSEGGRLVIRKRNSMYPDIPLERGAWYPVGGVLRVVEADIRWDL